LVRDHGQSAGHSDGIGTVLYLFVYASDLAERRFPRFGPMR
jgi:hypothetical protein